MKVLRLIIAGIIIFSVTFTSFYGKDKISDNGVKGEAPEYKGILTLWHVDSFEGGTGLRRKSLSANNP